MLSNILRTFVVWFLFASQVATIKIIPSPAALPSQMPAACRASLSTNIACGPALVQPREIEINVPFNKEFLTDYCNSTCTKSVQTWTAAVNTRCGSTKYDFPGNITLSGSDFANPFQWAHDSACVKGGLAFEFCYPDAMNHTLQYCDDCALKYFASMLNSTYGARKMTEKSFQSILSSCNASPTKYPYTTPAAVSTPPAATTMPVRQCSGIEYVVSSGDSCESIAAKNSLAVDRFLADNSIDFKCTSLSIGSSVCIQDSCKLHTIGKPETCKQILAGQPFTMNGLVAWNPLLETGCDNTTPLEGRTICVTHPGTDNYDFNATATFSWTFSVPSGSWVPGPTQGTPLGNSTTFRQFPIATHTLTRGDGLDPTAYFANCPVTGTDYDNGFEWEAVSTECLEMLEPYCHPVLTGTPLSSTTFPSSFMPSAFIPTETPAVH